MRKHTIIGVIVLMSISLLGIVGIQLYWINNAIKVRQQLFERNVHDALTKVVEKLETREAVSVVTNQMAALKADSLVEPVTATATQKILPKKPAGSTSATNISKVRIEKNKATEKPAKGTAFGTVTPTSNRPVIEDLYISRTDTFKHKPEHKLSGHSRTAIFQFDSTAGRKRFNRQLPLTADTIIFRKLAKEQPLRTEKLLDGAKTVKRLSHDLFRISVDSLRHMAFTLDSMRPIEISSINVRNDSVYIYKHGTTQPVYVYRSSKTENPLRFAPGTITHFKRELPSRMYSTRTRDAQPEHEIAVNTSSMAQKDEAMQKLEVKKDKLNEVVHKMMVEYVIRDIPLKERLNTRNLQALISDELKEKGIELDHGYHVVSANDDTVAVKQAAQLSKDARYFTTFLFPNDIIKKPDYLAVYFPDTQAYAIRSLAGMMSLSGLFTLIIIATFATTIHIIYKQKRLSEMKNDFINNMTHEFKTPIATISLATDSIFNPKVYGNPEKIKYYTSIIKQENKRMNAQVENVLQIALLEKNEFKLNLQPIDVHILILKAIESIQLQVEQRLGQINIKLDALEHELHSDEIHLFNVICNLLDNANKYSPATPEIELTTQNVNGGLLIAVDDKGMGMSKETQLRVFEKFYRVPTGNLHNVKGFGLGLSYVKAIVQAHHGNIKLWSEPGKGSRFEIFLPLKN